MLPLFLFQFGDLLDDVIDWFRTFSPWITLVGLAVGFILKFKNNVIRKIVKAIGKGQLVDILILMEDLTKSLPVEDIRDLLLRFRKSRQTEMEMKEGVMDLKKIAGIKKAVNSEEVTLFVAKYKEKKKSAMILNRKRWNQLKKDKDVDVILNSMLNIIIERAKLRRMSRSQNAEVSKIEEIIKGITSKENIKKKRAIRHEIERAREKLKRDEELEHLGDIRESLWKLFNR